MEKLAPDILRVYADALEDTRQLENVEAIRYTPEHDQQLFLALNRGKTERNLPEAGTIRGLLQSRLISVSTQDEQSVTLGIFYTTTSPFPSNKKSRLAVGIYPVSGEITRYNLRPTLGTDISVWESSGYIGIRDESAPTNDPFIMKTHIDLPNLIFFNSSPFRNDQKYQAELPTGSTDSLPDSKLHEDVLERNVMDRALWYISRQMKPYLILKEGYNEFMKENKHDPRYSELYQASRIHVFPRTGYVQYNR